MSFTMTIKILKSLCDLNSQIKSIMFFILRKNLQSVDFLENSNGLYNGYKMNQHKDFHGRGNIKLYNNRSITVLKMSSTQFLHINLYLHLGYVLLQPLPCIFLILPRLLPLHSSSSTQHPHSVVQTDEQLPPSQALGGETFQDVHVDH